MSDACECCAWLDTLKPEDLKPPTPEQRRRLLALLNARSVFADDDEASTIETLPVRYGD